MTLDDILQNLQSRYECRHGLYCARANTGEPYVQIGSGDNPPFPGTVAVMERRDLYRTEDEACRGFLRDFNRYADALPEMTKPILWWRYDVPHLFLDKAWLSRKGSWFEKERPDTEIRFAIKGRLLLSDKPIRWATIEDYDAEQEGAIIKPYGTPDLIH